jgi:AMP deaminase
MLINDLREQRATQFDPRDFYTIIKVDTHVHLSAAMTSKHLLDFIKHKVKTCPNVRVSSITSLSLSLSLSLTHTHTHLSLYSKSIDINIIFCFLSGYCQRNERWKKRNITRSD